MTDRELIIRIASNVARGLATDGQTDSEQIAAIAVSTAIAIIKKANATTYEMTGALK